MTPILGIMASSMQGAVGDYESISTTTLSSATPSVTFSSIPATYKHLQVRVMTGSSAAATDSILIQFNSDTTVTNYYWHRLYGDGSTAFSGAANANTVIDVSGTGTNFSGSVIDVLDYANTNKFKTVRTLSGYDANGSGRVGLVSTLWKNTNAVSNIVFVISGGANFPTYSSFALYGIK
jgi:hypothetical protein